MATPRTPARARATARARVDARRATRARARGESARAATSENAGARVALVAGALAVSLARDVDVARAFVGDIALDDVRYEAMERCPENQYVPNKQKTTCLRFTARATNAVKGRTIESANVFGFVEDAQGNSAATVNADGNSRTVLASIDAPIPKGESDVHFVVTVFKDSLENNGPLRLKAFKAVGSVADIDKRFTPFDACEVDPDSCL
ncbi:predicted protein [Ostreococcus lucimarinus CCE9901]|jgi:hypothetical protein|uniref:Uncharacterized protein n=1 Tax=Ostreococcus lucimarinus (strain CCE9901) TaxID=436017 RepID=A4RWG7_OSTLU|nr:predicted protein [Ostreococcus lucimarinus CCE9901]ABO95621.1 predicted protein [Ostreococcus lucimarinus CCE9901]|eukprot:XP_001417328.1 predicted protein [Ostreococcus lucimarinus CCE9901]